MDMLAEVLMAIRPSEVHWYVLLSGLVSFYQSKQADERRLNATVELDEQLTFSTHLVHPVIILAGEEWTRTTNLQKLVIQGQPVRFGPSLCSTY